MYLNRIRPPKPKFAEKVTKAGFNGSLVIKPENNPVFANIIELRSLLQQIKTSKPKKAVY